MQPALIPSPAELGGSTPFWSDVVARMDLEEAAAPRTPTPIGQRRRRGFDPTVADGRAKVELVRDDEGLLRWMYTPPFTGVGTGRRGYRSIHADERNVVQRVRFNDFGSNEVTQRLVELDLRLTPGRGMKRWVAGTLIDEPQPAVTNGRVLLLVHGTFSQSEMWFNELRATQEGRELLAQWEARYTAVLAFSHHTLSVGAWSNAIDLHRALSQVTVPIDVVCHSRGGLVASWLLRLDAVPVERLVFVGSPLMGTSLAAPDKLRSALDLLANYVDAVQMLGTAASPIVPFAAGVAGLAKLLGKMLRLGSGLPILDAAIALVPGLATQQAVSNNLDLQQLFADEWQHRPDMTAIGVTFRPDEISEPWWKFWRRFSNVGDQLKYGAADLVFPGPNDLVVDVPSMYELGGQRIPFQDLGISPRTHHTNYFRDASVLGYLAAQLQ